MSRDLSTSFYTRQPRISGVHGVYQCENVEAIGYGLTAPEAYADWWKHAKPVREQIEKDLGLLLADPPAPAGVMLGPKLRALAGL